VNAKTIALPSHNNALSNTHSTMLKRKEKHPRIEKEWHSRAVESEVHAVFDML